MKEPIDIYFNVRSTSFRLVVVAMFILAGCGSKHRVDKIQILIRDTSGNAGDVEVISFNKLTVEQIKLGSVSLDSAGRGKIEFELSKPLLVVIKINKRWIPMYLEPGYDLEATVDRDIKNILHFTGNGSAANNYLFKVFAIQQQYKEAGGTYINELDQESFFHRLDSLENSLTSFHQNYLDTVSINEKLGELLEKRNNISILNIKQSYRWNYGARNKFNIPESLNVDNQIPLDSVLLNIGMREYYELWHVTMHINYFIPPLPHFPSEQVDDIGSSKLEHINKVIKEGNYPEFIKEFLLAKNIDYWLGSMGIKPAVDLVYDNFKNEYTTSKYLPILETHYNKWLSISAGQIAPEIEGETINGEKVSRNDFIGKIIYVDVWATWCGPCIKEIPYSKKVQKKFANNDEIIFLNVSVDRNKNAWVKMITNDKEWNGLHIINDGSIFQAYQINGIPRFIIIDKKGNIVDSDAPRPSSGDILVKVLESLLSGAKTS